MKRPFPPCFYLKHGAYYLVKNNKWTPLGRELPTALAEYGRRTQQAKATGMAKLIDAALPSICQGKAENTARQYEAAAKILKRKLVEFEPQQVTQKTVYGIQASLAEHPNMANRVISVLRGVFNYAVKHAPGVTANPCLGVTRLLEEKRKRLITEDEWRAIHAQAGPRLQVIMELQYATGQRIGDVLSIRRSQIVGEGLTFKQQKTGKLLTVKWSPELRAAVARANAMSTSTLTLLRGRNGGAPDYRTVADQWTKACAAAGVIDARLNDQRAQSLTAAKRQGKNPQILAGHSSENMTTRYLRNLDVPEVEGPSLRQLLDARQKG